MLGTHTLALMSEDDFLEHYLLLCQRIYERMERDGSFPWSDSTDEDDMVDSDKSK